MIRLLGSFEESSFAQRLALGERAAGTIAVAMAGSKRRLTWVIGLVAAGLCLLPGSAAAYSQITLVSDPGDDIGRGESTALTSRTRTFEMTGNAVDFNVDLRYESGPTVELEFAGPDKQPLQAGRTYSDAQRAPFADPGHGGLSIDQDGRGCNTVAGSFRVVDLVTTANQDISRLRVTFEQHCDGAGPALRGELIYGYPEDGSDPLATPPASAPDTTKPSLGPLGLSTTVFRAARSGASIAARHKRTPIGTRVAFSLSEPAFVTFNVQRRRVGRRVGKHCRAITRADRKHRRCLRWTPLAGSFTTGGTTRQDSFVFRGRLNGKRLAPGTYRLLGRAQDAAHNDSTVRRATFRIVR